ncbi:MAG: right-handed parallel beta-helix repeat-containing protein, partial [Acidobacteriota bacterium]|nr:right-handed parallel beta-helix repeat-containing protein [Acidobacteriota bacterium]
TQAAIVSADGYGVKTVASREQIVKSNTVSQNGECGIQLSGDSAGSEISNNTLFFNTGQQFTPCGNIDLRSVNGNQERIVVNGNRIDNGTNGVMLTSSDRVTVEENTVTRNFQGIQLVSSNLNSFSRNNLNHNTVGIFMTGRFNEFDGNNVNTNDSQGIVVYVGGCPDPCSSMAGQGFSDTWGNSFRNNSVDKNGSTDVFDFSSVSGTQCTMDPGCNTNPPGPPPPPPNVPPGNYTPGTLDFWVRTDCTTASPSSICAK